MGEKAGCQGVGRVGPKLGRADQAVFQDGLSQFLDLVVADGRAGVVRVGADVVQGNGLDAGKEFGQKGEDGLKFNGHRDLPIQVAADGDGLGQTGRTVNIQEGCIGQKSQDC